MSSNTSDNSGKKFALTALAVLLLIAAGIFGGYAMLDHNPPAAPSPAPAPKPAAPKPPVHVQLDITYQEEPPPTPVAPAAPQPQAVSFAADIAPIFKNSCASCHGGNRPSGGLNLTALDATLRGGRSGAKAAIAGQSTQSLIVLYASDSVRGHEMPPLRQRAQHPALTQDQVALIAAWIDQGAN